METQGVIISNITLTRPTQKKTGYGENELSVLLQDPKFKDQLHNLTVKIEMTQKREVSTTQPTRVGGRRNAVYSVAEALKGHDKVSSSDRVKHVWINAMNITTMQSEGIAVGVDYGQLKNTVAYLLTEEYLTSEFRDGRLVSSPKRKGKGGAIVLDADGNFIFQDTILVTSTTHEEFKDWTYEQFVKFEESAKIPFVSELDAADGVPDETKVDGFFNAEFEEWFTEEYAKRNQKVLQEVA